MIEVIRHRTVHKLFEYAADIDLIVGEIVDERGNPSLQIFDLIEFIQEKLKPFGIGGPHEIFPFPKKSGQKRNDCGENERFAVSGVLRGNVVDVGEDIFKIENLLFLDFGLVDGGTLNDSVIESLFKEVAAGSEEGFGDHDIPVTAIDAQSFKAMHVVRTEQEHASAG